MHIGSTLGGAQNGSELSPHDQQSQFARGVELSVLKLGKSRANRMVGHHSIFQPCSSHGHICKASWSDGWDQPWQEMAWGLSTPQPHRDLGRPTGIYQGSCLLARLGKCVCTQQLGSHANSNPKKEVVWLAHWGWSWKARVWVPTLPLIPCVSLSESAHLSGS